MSKITIVTGLWDIGRDKLSNDWSRSYNHYLEKLNELLLIVVILSYLVMNHYKVL